MQLGSKASSLKKPIIQVPLQHACLTFGVPPVALRFCHEEDIELSRVPYRPLRSVPCGYQCADWLHYFPILNDCKAEEFLERMKECPLVYHVK